MVIGLLDNFVVSSPEILRRVLEMTDVEPSDHLKVVEGGICSAEVLSTFATAQTVRPIVAVIRFAELQAVGESMQ